MMHKEADLTEGLPNELAALLRRMIAQVDRLSNDLQMNTISPSDWQSQMEIVLAQFHQAAFMVGQTDPTIPPAAIAMITSTVQAELNFLSAFTAQIQSAEEFQAGWKARARQYAGAIKTSYWRGKTKMLPLPAMPAQGTQCDGNCGCRWRIVTIDEENGDYDCYWIREKKDNCQTCIQRAARWSPLRIRGGAIQI